MVVDGDGADRFLMRTRAPDRYLGRGCGDGRDSLRWWSSRAGRGLGVTVVVVKPGQHRRHSYHLSVVVAVTCLGGGTMPLFISDLWRSFLPADCIFRRVRHRVIDKLWRGTHTGLGEDLGDTVLHLHLFLHLLLRLELHQVFGESSPGTAAWNLVKDSAQVS